MEKIYKSIGFFLIGLSISGCLSYTAYTFQILRFWGLSLIGIITIIFIILFIIDDYAIEYFSISRLQYLGLLICIAFMIFIGITIQLQ